MKGILSLFRLWLQTRLCHASTSIVFGCLDVVHRFFYTILGLDKHPDYFRDWQRDRIKNYPKVVYPLPETGPAPKPRFSIWDTRGFYTTTVFFHYLDHQQAKAFLPRGLELDPALVNAEGLYPVAYMFGYQQDLRRVWMKLHGINYLEFAIGVLGLKCPSAQGYTGPFMYMPRLFLNRFYPTWLGWLCGYPKRLSRIVTGQDSYAVKSLFRGKPIFEAKFQPQGVVGGWRDFPNFQPWMRQLAAPQANCFFDDGFLFLYYDWPWRYARIQGVCGSVTVESDDIPGLPRGTHSFDSIDSSPVGGFRLAIPWELVAPFATKTLPQPFGDEDELPGPAARSTGAAATSGSPPA